MDRLLTALRMEVCDLLPYESAAAAAESGEPPSERIPLVESAALLQSDFGSATSRIPELSEELPAPDSGGA